VDGVKWDAKNDMKKTLVKVSICLASIVIMAVTAVLIAALHLFKTFRKIRLLDPFHDSRRHPLNSPRAARG
jgi:hypothetical protein